MAMELRAHRLIASLLAGLLALSWLAVPSAAHAQSEEGRELSIRPVGQAEAMFFDLQVAPGEERTLEVELENTGSDPIRARTYAADAYTIVNGGFGIRLFGEPRTGSTLWLEYPDEVLELAPGEVVTREVMLRLPADAAAGQHIAGLAVENAEPLRGSGDVALDQVVRKAIAVFVTVSGAVEPGLEIGSADHVVVGDRSVIGVGLRNTGNVLLRPEGTLVVLDDSEQEVARRTVAMDSFYGRTESRLEVPLDQQLPLGRYTVSLVLGDDEHGVEVSEPALPVTVEREEVAGPAAENPIERVAGVVGDLRDGDGSGLAVIGGVLVLVLVLAVAAGITMGRRAARRSPPGADEPLPPGRGGDRADSTV